MTRIKVCGVTLPDDAAMVAAAGVDYLGLNFWPRSRRHVAPERGALLAAAARAANPAIQLVGLFVDGDVDDVIKIGRDAGLDAIQLHGDESPAECRAIAARFPVWKAVPIAGPDDLGGLDHWGVTTVLLDAPSPGRGGSGQRFDWALGAQAVQRWPALHIVLAGGLDPADVAAAIAAVRPWAVDVASGVERSAGLKDLERVAAFVAAVRAASPTVEPA